MGTLVEERLVRSARDFAAKVHAGEKRKGSSRAPYTTHTDRVAQLVEEAGGTAEDIAVAHAHDTVETGDISVAGVAAATNARVGYRVGVLSDPPELKGLPPLKRKAQQLERLKHAERGDKLVKIADATANMESMAHDPPEDWGKQERLEYIRASFELVQGLRGVSPSLEQKFAKAYSEALAANSF